MKRSQVAKFSRSLGELFQVQVGYTSGANQFFHLSPSQAKVFGN
ncbi:MAG: hypothetical protein R2865_12610 [Deinococcales bacterium]